MQVKTTGFCAFTWKPAKRFKFGRLNILLYQSSAELPTSVVSPHLDKCAACLLLTQNNKNKFTQTSVSWSLLFCYLLSLLK